jgi:hypothetical protein
MTLPGAAHHRQSVALSITVSRQIPWAILKRGNSDACGSIGEGLIKISLSEIGRCDG